MSTFNVHEWNRKRYLSEEKVNEVAKEKPFRALIGTISMELAKLEPEEALDTIDRLILYLGDKATLYKDSLNRT